MEQDTETQKKGFWESRIECITAPSQFALAKKINDFYVGGRWIVGTQTFAPRRDDNLWTAFVYYKVRG